MSAETIYQSLYVQARGGLKRELTALSAHRPLDAQAAPTRGQAPRPDPGHGDDQRTPARGRGPGRARALGRRPDPRVDGVEVRGRHPGRTHHRVRDAAAPARRPRRARRSRRRWWPRCDPARAAEAVPDLGPGQRDGQPRQIAEATGLEIYFCDPHSPWQRGTNENTNGLLRQYLPKGTDLVFYGPGLLDNIAAELNSRPRKRHGFQTPAEVLDRLLSEATNNHGVA